MAKWKKGQKEFIVSLRYHERRGSTASIPKPILEHLGDPNGIKFEIKKNGNIVVTGDKN